MILSAFCSTRRWGPRWHIVLGAYILVAVSGCSSAGDDADQDKTAAAQHKPEVSPEVNRGPIVPKNYLETCTAEPQISCAGLSPGSGGSVPEEMRRRLRLPPIKPSEQCPAVDGRSYDGPDFGGTRLGEDPVAAIVAPSAPGARPLSRRGVLRFQRYRRTNWYGVKTLWFSEADYQGPVLMRARQLDGRHRLAFGETPAAFQRQIPGSGANVGSRTWPGAMYVKAPGCYGVQVDGRTFSSVIVFIARFTR